MEGVFFARVYPHKTKFSSSYLFEKCTNVLESTFMAKIITVTSNTAIDFFIEVESLSSQDNIQARNSFEFACGKGINVARAITSLETQVTCLGFVGNQSLQAFNEINSPLLLADFTGVEGKTRSNITLFDSVEKRETHIRTSGFTVTADNCRQLIEKLNAYIETGDIVILSGSLPGGAPMNFYQTLVELCHSNSAIPFLDSSGNSLRAGLEARPYLIKPNQQELEEIVGTALADEQAIVAAARSMIDQGIEWVYVSRAEKGVVVIGKNIALAAWVNELPGKVVSHIGCGDAMTAGLAVATLKQLGLEETIKTGISCGTANLFSMEPGRFNKTLQTDILAHTEIRPI